MLRYLVGLAVPSALFPWATLGVNVAGSFAIGLFGALAARFGWSEGVRLALTVGLCGGFTTRHFRARRLRSHRPGVGAHFRFMLRGG